METAAKSQTLRRRREGTVGRESGRPWKEGACFRHRGDRGSVQSGCALRGVGERSGSMLFFFSQPPSFASLDLLCALRRVVAV